jgi:sortase A
MIRRNFIKKGAMVYLYLPLLLCTIGYIIMYIVLYPIVRPVLSSMNLIISENKPDYSSKITSIFKDEDAGFLDSETVNEKDVVMPTYGTHYARLEISSVSIKTDLYFGDSTAVLKKGVGQYIGSSIPGYGKPLLIGGHNISAFRALQHVKKGDTVVITTNYGVYKYEITGTKVADHRDKKAYDLSQEKEQLILYTCYPFNKLGLTSKRYFVYADKVSGPRIVSAPAV